LTGYQTLGMNDGFAVMFFDMIGGFSDEHGLARKVSRNSGWDIQFSSRPLHPHLFSLLAGAAAAFG
jgi:hypothetical protein